jgi:hypothetical protein
MRSIDDTLRAQARALIAVLDYYALVHACGGDRPPIWRDLEAFGAGSGTSVDLQRIARKASGTTAAALRIVIKHRAPNAAVHLALATFTNWSVEDRLLEPSRWIALALAFMGRSATPEGEGPLEVFNLLQSAFETEITTEFSAGFSMNYLHGVHVVEAPRQIGRSNCRCDLG